MNEMLGEYPYFCDSETLTVVDIVFYNEIHTIVALTGTKLNKTTMQKLAAWM
jgi:hypothetical protein